MKKLLPAASFLALSILTASALRSSAPAMGAEPARAQDELAARVSALESELATRKQELAETRALLDQTLGFLDTQSKAAEALMARLDEAESQGFAVGENWRSRQTLLAGFRDFLGVQRTAPKAPEKPAPKAPAPARPVRK